MDAWLARGARGETRYEFDEWVKNHGETATGNPIQDSLLGFIPGNATAAERQDTIHSLAAAILGMTGDTTITWLAITPAVVSAPSPSLRRVLVPILQRL